MFVKYINRILKTAWSRFGLAHIQDKTPDELTNDDTYHALTGLGAGLQAFAEELATLGAESPSYDAFAPITVSIDGLNDEANAAPTWNALTIPTEGQDRPLAALDVRNYGGYTTFAAGVLNNEGGWAGFFQGPVNINPNQHIIVAHNNILLNINGGFRWCGDVRYCDDSTLLYDYTNKQWNYPLNTTFGGVPYSPYYPALIDLAETWLNVCEDPPYAGQNGTILSNSGSGTAVTTATGCVNTCAWKFTDGGKVLVGDSKPIANDLTQDFYISFWTKASSWPSQAMSFVGFHETIFPCLDILYSPSTPRIQLYIDGAGANDITANLAGALSTGTCYFIQAWWDASTTTGYISLNNGTPGSDTNASVGSSFVDYATKTLMVGNDYAGAGAFTGTIENLLFLNRIPSEAERTALYNSGSGIAYPFTTSYEADAIADADTNGFRRAIAYD